MKQRDYSNFDIARAIDEFVHNAIYREMLKDHYINGLTFKELEDKYGYSLSQTKRIIYKNEKKIF